MSGPRPSSPKTIAKGLAPLSWEHLEPILRSPDSPRGRAVRRAQAASPCPAERSRKVWRALLAEPLRSHLSRYVNHWYRYYFYFPNKLAEALGEGTPGARGASEGAGLPMLNAEELFHDVLLLLHGRICRLGGLARPEDDWDIQRWLGAVARNAVIDLLRPYWRREARESPLLLNGPGDRIEASSEGESPRPLPDALVTRDEGREERFDAQRAFSSITRRLAALGPAVPRLAWVLLEAPQLYDPQLVHLAAAAPQQGHPGQPSGLLRPVPETLALLDGWFRQHAEPQSVEARRHLAWILRSTDRSSPEEWRQRHPDELRKALDTLRTWVSRYKQALRKELPAESR